MCTPWSSPVLYGLERVSEQRNPPLSAASDRKLREVKLRSISSRGRGGCRGETYSCGLLMKAFIPVALSSEIAHHEERALVTVSQVQGSAVRISNLADAAVKVAVLMLA